MKKLNEVLDRVIGFMSVIAAVMMGLLTLIISYATISRYVFRNPLAWVVELSCYFLLFVTFLAAPWLQRTDGHVKVDLILGVISPKNQARLNAVTSVLGLVITAVMVVFGYRITMDNYLNDVRVMNILSTPQYILLAVIPLGSFFLVIEFFRRLLSELKSNKGTGDNGGGL